MNRLIRRFVADLPLLGAIWLGTVAAVAVLGVLSERMSIAESLALSVTFLPVAVPLSPLLWLRRFASARDKTLPAVGAGCAWFLVTMPIAILASVALADVLGVN